MRRAALALLGLAALPAAAEERPLFVPTRDVAVTYRVTQGQAAGREMSMAWLAAAQKLRVEMAPVPGWSVVDRANRRMLMVMDAQRVVMELPLQGGPGGLSIPTEPPASARFTRAGTATIAGQACTAWRYEDGANRGETCLTADGVMLRSSGGQGERAGAVEAVAVAYGPQDPARFQAPAGYRTLQMPAGLPPAAASPGR
ncbi:DUF4412 domain-containing protein [Paracraurococcus lichenis]|uniref:DUF4412 domain-containing protein n=1 Tax=Paracraurococcus lichenis TaxID=3064888 RepID=A0ABT9E119_9PROT|nr:DUF4412 domain-containing protein [Paracraurococcus sp. LOR1-02]MDO9709853.1 DUF4412 domain-containing protein [Paracraurococcus sp. LOR1-02]